MLEILIIISVLVFSIRSIIFMIGAWIERKQDYVTNVNYYPFVSVVVAARNEEDNIANCLRSISRSNYPSDYFEIVLVNDRSTDDTLTIAQELKKEIRNLKIINITLDSQKRNLSGKPGAIALGIEESIGDIIMMTDADCTVNPNWISNIVDEFSNENVGLVASFTNVTGNRAFDKIQAIEWAYLHTMASAGIGLNQPLGCYGNNLSVRKIDYENIGGYRNIKFSVTEDLALLQAISHSGKKVKYLTKADADVDTKPCSTFGEYLQQRHRWAVGGLALGWRALIFVLSSAFLYLGLIASVVYGNLIYLILIIISRMIWDFFLISRSLYRLNKKQLIKWIPAAVLFFLSIEAIVPFLVLKRNVKWKNQIFKR